MNGRPEASHPLRTSPDPTAAAEGLRRRLTGVSDGRRRRTPTGSGPFQLDTVDSMSPPCTWAGRNAGSGLTRPNRTKRSRKLRSAPRNSPVSCRQNATLCRISGDPEGIPDPFALPRKQTGQTQPRHRRVNSVPLKGPGPALECWRATESSGCHRSRTTASAT